MTFLDFFAGIGGARLGLELAGLKCIGFCEKDKYAIKSYRAMFDTEGEWFSDDISKLKSENIPYADIWVGGFPCQNVSVAGRQDGIRGDRSGLYFTFIEKVKGKKEEDKPRWIIIENVKNLLSINGGHDFSQVLFELDEAGYDINWQVLNSKDFGVPQNRERVFIIGNLRSRGAREVLPIRGENAATLKQIVAGCQGERVYDIDGLACTLTGCGGGGGAKTGLYAVGNINPSGKGMNGNVYSSEGISPTLTTNKGEGIKIVEAQEKIPVGFNRIDGVKGEIETAHTLNSSNYRGINRNQTQNAVLEAYPVLTPERLEKRQNGIRMKDDGEPMFTLTGVDRHGVVIGDGAKNVKIRRLTPKECFRIQGFPDDLFEKARGVNSDAQLYKQAGNAITVNVAYAIGVAVKNAENTC